MPRRHRSGIRFLQNSWQNSKQIYFSVNKALCQLNGKSINSLLLKINFVKSTKEIKDKMYISLRLSVQMQPQIQSSNLFSFRLISIHVICLISIHVI